MPRARKGPSLVEKTTEALREKIFAAPAGSLIGPLYPLARSLGVGIVTLQQAARVLEHEGLLDVRRGPGGGYYGTRPDNASLERALDSFMRMNPTSFEEALDMTSLLFTELATAAARCVDVELRAQLAALSDRIGAETAVADFGVVEAQFQELLFRMVRRPLFELLTRVTLHYAASQQDRVVHSFGADPIQWREGRRRIIKAILANDEDLTRLEATRRNRNIVLASFGASSPSSGGRR